MLRAGQSFGCLLSPSRRDHGTRVKSSASSVRDQRSSSTLPAGPRLGAASGPFAGLVMRHCSHGNNLQCRELATSAAEALLLPLPAPPPPLPPACLLPLDRATSPFCLPPVHRPGHGTAPLSEPCTPAP